MARRNVGLDVHSGRVLLLLRHFGPTADQPLDGLTKLAKLDFLLRYPVFTERLLIRRNQSWAIGTEPSRSEELAVESRMIRYKYGPWDDRYYPILGTLAGLSLMDVTKNGRSFRLSLTVQGRDLAQRLAAQDEWSTMDLRAEFLHHEFDMSGSKLKKLIYTELPDVVDRPLRSLI
jgi:hypothetical protein